MGCDVFGGALALWIWAGAIVFVGSAIVQHMAYLRVRRTADRATAEMDAFWVDLNERLTTAPADEAGEGG